MKRIIAYLLVLIFTGTISYAGDLRSSMPDETLNYKVLYKWGLVNKQAGRATVKMSSTPTVYKAYVTARTEPWADHIYHLRDTLRSVINRQTLVPKSYVRIAHENGRYERDSLVFTQSGNSFKAVAAVERKRKKETEIRRFEKEFDATGMTVDFLSAFYYLRTLDFNSMLPGHSVTINIFSGSSKELLKFAFKGIETIKIDGKRYNAFKVEFTFTRDGKMSSDPLTAWITDDNRRIPLQIEGKLPVGKVLCVLNP